MGEAHRASSEKEQDQGHKGQPEPRTGVSVALQFWKLLHFVMDMSIESDINRKCYQSQEGREKRSERRQNPRHHMVWNSQDECYERHTCSDGVNGESTRPIWANCDGMAIDQIRHYKPIAVSGLQASTLAVKSIGAYCPDAEANLRLSYEQAAWGKLDPRDVKRMQRGQGNRCQEAQNKRTDEER